jgi:PDZ domain-containing protein
MTPIGVLASWLDPERTVVARDQLYAPGETAAQEQTRAISQMDQSKIDAASVVLKELTGYPKDHGTGVLVEGVVSGCSADGRLYPGDRILSVGGTTANTVRAASAAIESAPSGSSLRFDISVDGTPRTVTLVRRPCGEKQQPLVGVSLVNSFPIQISISTGDIGGPSAGLMFALGLYDLLTPGDLTGGRTIAGTGEIGVDGTVYPIGGVAQKVIAASDAGASIFLVPKSELAPARTAAEGRDLRLVPVSSFDQAVSWLRANA